MYELNPMSTLYVSGTNGRRPDLPVELPTIDLARAVDPSRYIPDDGLAAAVNVALTLRQPLLVTGEPGTGKTQLAFNVAWQLGLDEPHVFATKSDSVARDLFYRFDTLARFRSAQAGHAVNDASFLEFNALGRAILLANPPGRYNQVAPPELSARGPLQSVVLIDEIDKAPRDFPNDLLNEIDRFYFQIPELHNIHIEAAVRFRPVVIITSNLEKSLPDAFLRRCLFYHIPFPDAERLEEIVLARASGLLGAATEAPLVNDMLAFFTSLRRPNSPLRRPPGTTELLNWIIAMLAHGVNPGQPLHQQSEGGLAHLCALAKLGEDQERIEREYREWVTKSA
jgi:MoxR-like ATPase